MAGDLEEIPWAHLPVNHPKRMLLEYMEGRRQGTPREELVRVTTHNGLFDLVVVRDWTGQRMQDWLAVGGVGDELGSLQILYALHKPGECETHATYIRQLEAMAITGWGRPPLWIELI